jgi:hypothetical protein
MPGHSTDHVSQPAVIRIAIAETMPIGIEDGLDIPNVPFKIIRRPIGPIAGLEAHIPAAVALFVAAGYFNGFLRKLGEDHYCLVKSMAKRLLERAGKTSVRTVTASGPVQTVHAMNFSVAADLPSGARCKLMLKADLSPDQAARAVDLFLDLVRDAYRERSIPAVQELLTGPPIWNEVVLTYDPGLERLVLVPYLGRQ